MESAVFDIKKCVENDDDIVETADAAIRLDTWRPEGVTGFINLFAVNKDAGSIILLILLVTGIVHFKSTLI